jgi:hypothetical protein
MPIQGAILSAFASQESSAQNSSPLKLKMAREPRRNSITYRSGVIPNSQGGLF